MTEINFIKKKQLPISTISTLNSIFTYGDSYGVKLHSLDSSQFKIVWKIFHSQLTLILIEPHLPVDERLYFDKLEMLFNALILMYGLDDLINISNVEKFKKEIKASFNLLDSILDTASRFDLFGGYLTDSSDALLLTSESTELQEALNESCNRVGTSLACLKVNGKVVVASAAWWDLNPTETYLISHLCLTLSESTSRDIPIYLPFKSPNTALRLLSYSLTSSVLLCFICEERPSVDFVEEILKNLWHPVYKSLVSLKQCLPRSLPVNLTLDINMVGFLLIDKRRRRCFSSLCANEKNGSVWRGGCWPVDEARKRFEVLKYCYLNIATNYFRRYYRGVSDESDGKISLTEL